MVPADADDIKEAYQILLNELTQYNPEMLNKQRVLAITKSDLIDEELEEGLSKDLPDVPHVFISAVAGRGIEQLKDMLWEEINRKPVSTENLVHRDRDVYDIDFEDDEEEISADDEEGDVEVDW